MKATLLKDGADDILSELKSYTEHLNNVIIPLLKERIEGEITIGKVICYAIRPDMIPDCPSSLESRKSDHWNHLTYNGECVEIDYRSFYIRYKK